MKTKTLALFTCAMLIGLVTVNGQPIKNIYGDNPLEEADIYTLAKVITGEQRGGSYLEQLAVGAVVMNRVKNSNYPNTVYAVVYAPGAFLSMANEKSDIIPTDSAFLAALDAIKGIDPTNGALDIMRGY